ncbi:electron transfer flavoprotein subunit alpha/FixB family protein [Conexibacter sp. DBS9H8]|uniref:electron transfer flavoprotein subunit alpha/FixB family protein n=1 Tax=Conexibacter sp. DBS9H8 TaxID=2937801 RepID=UPI00200D3ED9|nr:electron transfer flavoprotein subunit alpha/FixB family protein [Conexibacter sp. DBS9H8]
MSGVLVIAEARQGALRDISFELITAAREISAAGSITVALIGSDPGLAAQLNATGVSEVITIASPVDHFEPHVSAAAVGRLVDELSPAVVLAGHTIDSLGFGAAVAAVKDAGFASDVTSLAWDGALTVQRGLYGDKFLQTLTFPGKETVVILVRPGTFGATSPGNGSANVRPGADVDASAVRSRHTGYREPEVGDVDITKADFLLAIGRGAGAEDESDLEPYYELAERIGATLVSSRPLVDAGLVPSARQVGQSGKTVAPKVYLALGVSGAVQHLIGMRKADTIIAVNTDPSAPIFGAAHYGSHADLSDVADALKDAFS